MVKMNQSSLNKEMFIKLWNYIGQNGYVKQIKKELKTFSVTQKDCLNWKKYRK